ncbi:MAG: c-type cytochrome [Acidobacteriota bacterium]
MIDDVRGARRPGPGAGRAAAGTALRRGASRAAAAAALSLLWVAAATAAGRQPLEGDPFRGRQLLSEKLCTRCHSVWGHGGVLGPEMSTAVAGKGWLDLVGDFWNHTPRMIDAMVARGHRWPTLDQGEMADLLSYLYYLRLFDEPGDPERGSAAYSQHRCADCHSLGGRGGSRGGPLDRFSAYPSSVALAQAMWNAGPVMQRDQLGRGTAIPTFSRDEMADIQAYVRAEAIRGDRRVELLPLPDPSRGAAVFKIKRCPTCHHPGGGGAGPDLRRSALNMTVSEIGGILWNHSYAMNDRMRALGIPFPHFERTEMADLIAYLYFLSFVSGEGDPDRGASLFRERGCATCHAGPEAEAMDLSGSELVADPIALSAAMWNHAPEMHELMAEKAVAWPKFDPGDMLHLTAYLRRIAPSPKAGKE